MLNGKGSFVRMNWNKLKEKCIWQSRACGLDGIVKAIEGPLENYIFASKINSNKRKQSKERDGHLMGGFLVSCGCISYPFWQICPP